MPVPDAVPMDYPRSVAAMMWPDDVTTTLVRRPPRRGASPAREWFVLPTPSRPRILLPSGCPQAARMLKRHGDRLAPRAARFVLASAVRSRLLDVLPVPRLRVDRDEERHDDGATVEDYLAGVLGQAVVTGVLLGTPRVNRKPVLQVFGSEGQTLAFVKVAHDEATRALVRREAENLEQIESAQLRLVESPEALDLGRVGDVELLVLSPLASSQQKRGTGPPPLPAMAELARVLGVTTDRLVDTPFWERIVVGASLSRNPATTARLEHVITSVASWSGQIELPFGSWHGDWAAWNMGHHAGRVQLWDWERFSSGVPVGFDAIHFCAQLVRHNQPGLRPSEDALLGQVPSLLEDMGGATEQPDLIVVLYLLELVQRFLRMEQGPQQSPLHPRAEWALSFAERLLR